ncbi:hypothetical protein M0811_14182 [Anaeramoeba ignava]|uniref:Uncharacterized protein n=1 Tax=Anaeramoeba ignava TaxID=1746090 RepID=A0A9Q0LWL5_ANAIG|nr:hypothetical protein M0811_14182 [Anaeramoeba ignava]
MGNQNSNENGFVYIAEINYSESNSDISYSLDTDAYNYEVDEFLDDTQEQFIFYILSKTKNKLRLKEIVSSTLNSACCEKINIRCYSFIKITNISYSTNFGGLKQLQNSEKFKHELSNENTPLSIKKITNSKINLKIQIQKSKFKNPNSKIQIHFKTIISPCKIVSPTTTSPKIIWKLLMFYFLNKSPSHKVKEKYLENLENSKQNQFRRSDLKYFSQFYDNSQVEK